MLAEQDIVLRKVTIADIVRMALLANNKKIFDNVRDLLPHPYTEADAVSFINMIKDEDPMTSFAIDYQNEFCGMAGLVKQPDVYRLTAEIGYWLGEPYWNKGIATTAVKLLTRYGFDELKLVRIHTGIFEYNKGSMRVLEKCGYRKECIFEKSIIKNGRIWNEHRYAIITTNNIDSLQS